MRVRYFSDAIALIIAFDSIIALSLPSINPRVDTQSNVSSQLSGTFPSVSSGDVTISGTYIAPPDANENPLCDGRNFGYNINRASCDEAMSHATWYSDNYWFTYGQRGQGLWDIQLPFRRLSCKHSPPRKIGEDIICSF